MSDSSSVEESLSYFNRSLDVLHKKTPLLAHLLTHRLAPLALASLSFCKTSSGALNLKHEVPDHTYYYHDPIDPKMEAKKWFDSIHKETLSTLFVYGIGLGYYYEAAKEWLKEQERRTLVFLESDLKVLYMLLQTERGYLLLCDPQVEIVFVEETQLETMLNEVSWSFLLSPYCFSILPLYEKIEASFSHRLPAALASHISRKKVIASEYFSFGQPFFSNFYSNLLKLPSAYLGAALFGQFRGVSAVICGAGPSLSASLPLLRQIKGRLLLIAGGSALNALIPEGIIPDFAVAVDPFPSQYSRLAATTPFQIPCFYRGRLFKQALDAISGKRLYLSGGGGYDMPLWFEEELGIETEELDSGLSVLNLSLSIAHALGCKTALLVGGDFGFIQDAHYAKEVTKHLKEPSAKVPTSFILGKNVHGSEIKTLPKWVEEAAWISRFAKQNPEIELIHCTHEGLEIEGVTHQPFAEALKSLPKNPVIPIPSIDKLIEPHALSRISKENIISLLERMKNSLENTRTLLSQLIDQWELLAQRADVGSLHPPFTLSLLESDLEMEIGYTYLLRLFSRFFDHFHQRNFKKSELQEKEGNFTLASLQKIKLYQERALFLLQVCEKNLEWLAEALSDSI